MRRRNRWRGLGGLGFDLDFFGSGEQAPEVVLPSRKQARKDKQWARGEASRSDLRNTIAGRMATANAQVMLTTGALLAAGLIVWFLSRKKAA